MHAAAADAAGGAHDLSAHVLDSDGPGHCALSMPSCSVVLELPVQGEAPSAHVLEAAQPSLGDNSSELVELYSAWLENGACSPQEPAADSPAVQEAERAHATFK